MEEEEEFGESFSIRREQNWGEHHERTGTDQQGSFPSLHNKRENNSREKELLHEGEVYTIFTVHSAADCFRMFALMDILHFTYHGRVSHLNS